MTPPTRLAASGLSWYLESQLNGVSPVNGGAYPKGDLVAFLGNASQE